MLSVSSLGPFVLFSLGQLGGSQPFTRGLAKNFFPGAMQSVLQNQLLLHLISGFQKLVEISYAAISSPILLILGQSQPGEAINPYDQSTIFNQDLCRSVKALKKYNFLIIFEDYHQQGQQNLEKQFSKKSHVSAFCLSLSAQLGRAWQNSAKVTSSISMKVHSPYMISQTPSLPTHKGSPERCFAQL